MHEAIGSGGLVEPINETELLGAIQAALANPHINGETMKILCDHVGEARRMLFKLRQARMILFELLFDSAHEEKEDKTDG